VRRKHSERHRAGSGGHRASVPLLSERLVVVVRLQLQISGAHIIRPHVLDILHMPPSPPIRFLGNEFDR
jgi:hypothetical protein